MLHIYIYLLKDEETGEIYQLPIAPEEMLTKVETKNKTHETIGLGEISTLSGAGLRKIYLKFLLPNDLSLPFIQKPYSPNSIIEKPVKYMNKIRQIKEEKRTLRLMITRILPNNQEIFSGNLLVSIEDYTTYEKAGENGDFWVEITLKEYREIPKKSIISIDKKSSSYSIASTRDAKNTPKTHTVVKGDTLWEIAKTQLNNATRWQEIANLNNIAEPRKLRIGTVLTLP